MLYIFYRYRLVVFEEGGECDVLESGRWECERWWYTLASDGDNSYLRHRPTWDSPSFVGLGRQ